MIAVFFRTQNSLRSLQVSFIDAKPQKGPVLKSLGFSYKKLQTQLPTFICQLHLFFD